MYKIRRISEKPKYDGFWWGRKTIYILKGRYFIYGVDTLL